MLTSFKDKPVKAIKPEFANSQQTLSHDSSNVSRDANGIPRITSSAKPGTSTTPAKSFGSWKNALITHLDGYYGDTKLSDVIVFVGGKQIPTHKLILDVNSTLLDAAKESSFTSSRTEVNLMKWSDITDVVIDVIKSFYSGNITITSDNIKAVYKFSKCFNIVWLVEHCLKLFQTQITHHNVLDLIRFSSTVSCDRLKEICLHLLNPTFISGLTDSKLWELCDVNTVKVVLSSPHSNISEIERFELACKWFETRPKLRSDSIKSLLTCINFATIRENDLLGRVYDWISVYPELDDKTRLDLLVSMNKHIRVPGILRLQASSRNHEMDDVGTDSNTAHIIQDIVTSVTKRRSQLCTTPSQLLAVLRHSFIRSDKDTCFSIIEYMSDNRLVDRENVTELCKLYHMTSQQGIINLVLHYFSDHMVSRVHDVMWEELCSEAVKRVISRLEGGQNEYLLLEIIMRWMAVHSKEIDNVMELLSLICYNFIPSIYMSDIFMPYIRTYIPDVAPFSCTRHSTHKTKSHIKKGTAMIRVVPKEFYFIKNFEHRVKGYTIRVDKSDEASPLKLGYTRPSGKCRVGADAALVLYDRKKTFSSYPTAGHITLRQMRRIVNDYSDLHFMLLNV